MKTVSKVVREWRNQAGVVARMRGPRPPPRGAEDALEEQSDGAGAEERDEGGRPPGHLDGLAEQGQRDDVGVDGQDGRPGAAVLEVDGEQAPGRVAEAAGEQLLRHQGLERLVGKEEQRILAQTPEPGDGVDEQRRHEGGLSATGGGGPSRPGDARPHRVAGTGT